MIRGAERIARYLTIIMIINLTYVGIACAILPAPPVLKNENVQLQQYITDLYNNHNVLETVLITPNGTRYGKNGDMVIYNDGTQLHLYKNISSPIGQTWTEVVSSGIHSIPAGGVASQALIKLSGTDYDVGWGNVQPFDTSMFGVFGGAGTQGAVIVSANTNFSAIDDANRAGVAQYTSLTIDSGKILTVDTGYAHIAVSGDCTIHGTITVSSYSPALLATGYIKLGGGGGDGAVLTGADSGGARGTPGSKITSALAVFLTGGVGDNATHIVGFDPGWVRWGGGMGGSNGQGGIALGGGILYIEVAGTLIYDGAINCIGANGIEPDIAFSNGGGAGGGVVIIRAKTITTNTGATNVSGGSPSGVGTGTAYAGGEGFKDISTI